MWRRLAARLSSGRTPAGASASCPASGPPVSKGCFPKIVIERRFWLSTHRKVHDTARMRVVRAWLKALTETVKDKLQPFR